MFHKQLDNTKTMPIDFKPIKENDFSYIASVYNYYVLNSTATFHTQQLTVEQLQQNLPNGPKYQTYLIYYNQTPCGYCYIAHWRPREAYNRSAEITLYVEPGFHDKGIGKQTLMFLEKEARKKGISNLLGVITAENTASVSLFKKAGFQKVGHLINIGEKFGRLLDVLTYQKEL